VNLTKKIGAGERRIKDVVYDATNTKMRGETACRRLKYGGCSSSETHMAKRYRAGIIGLGFIGGADQVSGDRLAQKVENLDGTHLKAFLSNSRVEVVCGSSRDEGRRLRFTEKNPSGVQTYADWREMLRVCSLDIVSVAVYTPLHAEMVVACAGAGIPVIYCEKPIAATIGEAEGMLEACRSSGSLLVINHNRRFTPNLRRLRSFIARGDLGELTSVSARWPSGRLGNVGTHILDAVRMLTGVPAVGVSGTLDESEKPDCRGSDFCDPGGWGIIRLEGGCMVTVDAANYAKCPISIQIQGSLGIAAVSGGQISVELFNGGSEQWPADSVRKTSMDVAVGEIVDWLDARSGDGRPPAFLYDAQEAVEVLETIIAFHASHRRSGAWIDLPLSGPDRDIVLRSG
jgi:predicted dehydrogenase